MPVAFHNIVKRSKRWPKTTESCRPTRFSPNSKMKRRQQTNQLNALLQAEQVAV
jgi:hypothetical protein